MSAYALELNDAEIVAWDATHELLRDSGYAYLGASPWRFGAAAAHSARLHPHDTLTAHYAQMDAPRIGATAIAAAEVIYHQMRTWRAALPDTPGIWLTSGAASGAQLGTLLGVAQTAGLTIGALLDRAVAAASALPVEGTVFCIDVELERGLITEVHLQAGRAVRHGVVVLPELGLRPLVEAWCKGFARQMVQATRFDPLHVAATEQALFDALPGWLEQLTHAPSIEEAVVEADSGRYGIEYRAANAIADVADACRLLSARLHAMRRAGQRASILLTATAARLPGMIEAVQAFPDCDVFTAKVGQAAQAAIGALEVATLTAPATSLLLAMPHHPYPGWIAVRVAAAPVEDAATATHVVFAGRAVRLAGPAITVGSGVDGGARNLQIPATVAGVSRRHCSLILEAGQPFVLDHSRFGSFLNEERVTTRAPVRVGDRLRLGNPGVEFTFVRLE